MYKYPLTYLWCHSVADILCPVVNTNHLVLWDGILGTDHILFKRKVRLTYLSVVTSCLVSQSLGDKG